MRYKRQSLQVSPELFGPILSSQNLQLQKTMESANVDKKLKLITSFVPDELVCLLKSNKKIMKYEFVIILCIDTSSVHSLLDELVSVNNISSTYNLVDMYNLYMSTIIEKIYLNGGDVIKFTASTILSLWKQDETKMPHDLMCSVVTSAFAIKKSINNLKNISFSSSLATLKAAISAGSVTFASIGHDDDTTTAAAAYHYVIAGEPMTAVREAIKVGKPGDLILAESAWEHCILSNYVYVIQDKSHIKMIKELKKQESGSFIKNNQYLQKFFKMTISSAIPIYSVDSFMQCRTNLDDYKSQLKTTIRSFIVKPIIEQINCGKSLNYLTEMRNVCVVLIEITLIERTLPILISFANKCHAIIVKACESVGRIEDVSLRRSSVLFRIVFGAHSYLKNLNHCRFGVTCASKLLHSLKRMNHVDGVTVGVSTGASCCTVIGNVARRHYAIIGPPIAKSAGLLLISRNKVICDLDTVVFSDIKRSRFHALGLSHAKEYVFEYNDDLAKDSDDLLNGYPILDRFQELEHFHDILNEIGLAERRYVGIIIEGSNRVGKSRILDAFVAAAESRQIAVLKLVLHSSYATKPYSVIYKILAQMLGAEECETLDEIQRNIVEKLGHVVRPDELCYMNKIFRVQFKLSNRYIHDSDWDRYRKSIIIFDKIVKVLSPSKQCILLDDVEYMDYMSWQFLTRAISNANVVLAVTIVQADSWEDLSRVEVDICKDKRLLRHGLSEAAKLRTDSLASLVCQFLEVQAVSLELRDFIVTSGVTHPGWYELFVTLMTLCRGFDLVSMTPNEASMQELFFPDMLLVTRISNDLLPDEVAPPLPWNKRNKLAVCLTNDNFRVAESFVDLDLYGLAYEIYVRLNLHEQDVIRCASMLGEVFQRCDLEMLIWNHETTRTSAAIENLARARILGCAALHRRCTITKVADLSTTAAAACSMLPRNTFSDMHHLLRCCCHSRSDTSQSESRSSPQFARCQFLEFKVSVFHEVVCEQINDVERKELNEQIVEIVGKDAKKCLSCGGGSFLKIPGSENRNARPSYKTRSSDDLESMQESRSASFVLDGRSQSSVRFADERRSRSRVSDSNKISIMQASYEAEEINVCVNALEKRDECPTKEKPSKWAVKINKKSRVHPSAQKSAKERSALRQLRHVDFRNCGCLAVINYIFWKLKSHMKHIDNNEKIIDFMMEYAAGLIDYGQPNYALRCLYKADEKNDYVNTYNAWKNPAMHAKMIKKSVILCLRGNAYTLLGNYPQAKTNYAEALALYKHSFTSSELLACYKAMYERARQRVRWAFTHETAAAATKVESEAVHVKHEQATIVRQNVASCLSLVSMILMIDNHLKTAKLASLQSIAFGFSSYDSSSFQNQCQLYLSTAQIYVQLEDLSLVASVEKYILFAIDKKSNWENSDDFVMVCNVYACIFRISLLRGQFEKAAHFGVKALRIARSFRMVKLELKLSTLLVHAYMHLKRLGDAVNTLQQLRDLAALDIDKSAMTWYYSLCMDLLLDAGTKVESYDTCANYARTLLAAKPNACVVRDSNSLRRLAADLWLWQLLNGDATSIEFVMGLDRYTKDFAADDFMQIATLCKVIECHLILLTNCINMKKGSQMEILLADIDTLMKLLRDVAKLSNCAKPCHYLFKAYLCLLHSRLSKSMSYLEKARKCATAQKSSMTMAWVVLNKKTWKAVSYKNKMARHWEENIGYRNTVNHWQDVDALDTGDWSDLLYPLPVPDSYI